MRYFCLAVLCTIITPQNAAITRIIQHFAQKEIGSIGGLALTMQLPRFVPANNNPSRSPDRAE